MGQKQQDQELSQLKEEINLRLARGRGAQDIEELMLFLAESSLYQGLKQQDGQLSMLDSFLNIWLREKQRLPESAEDIFCQVGSLKDLVTKYRKILFCALRVENGVPESYVDEALEWLEQPRISGVAIGEIVVRETSKKEENLMHVAQGLKRRGQIPNAILLLQYANERYPERERLLLEEADCWMREQQWNRAYKLLAQIENPTAEIRDILTRLQQVLGNG
ncbi:MAG: hypothetical protein K2O34_06900 [Acetatifactor sp.]|nr:hypothetical protein [Acetatifactor sp.]